jgi:hypothetical protein
VPVQISALPHDAQHRVRVPVRQWVLTVPYRLRYRMEFDHGFSRAVLGVYMRVLFDI